MATKRVRRSQVNAAATAVHIVATAQRLFFEKGYSGTSVERIAREAGVAVQTVYNAVGSKGALLRAVFQMTVSGGEVRSLPEMLSERAARVTDAPGFVDMLADWLVDLRERTGPLWQVLDEAAAQDPEVRDFAAERARQRLATYQRAAAAAERFTDLRPGLGRTELAALGWAIGSPGTYRMLVGEMGWTPARYGRWVRSVLTAALARG